MRENPFEPLNETFELMLIEPLHQDIPPISRLIAYLCLRYKVQAMIRVGGARGRALGFFDILRNILIVTDEDDMQGVITLEIRVYPRLPEDALLRRSSYTLPDVPFAQVGSEWFAERILINKQHQQMRGYEQETYDIDYNHPLIKSLEQAGLRINHESEDEALEMIPAGSPINVDAVVQTFLAYKPGAKFNPVAEKQE